MVWLKIFKETHKIHEGKSPQYIIKIKNFFFSADP